MDTRLMKRLPAWASARTGVRRLALVLLSCGAGAGFASGAGVTTGNDGGARPLVVSLDFVVPEYQAGAKFRSPATIDTALAEDLAKRLARPLAVVGSAPVTGTAAPAGRAEPVRIVDLRITTVADLRSVPDGYAVIPLDYRAAPMAIMRSDSTIRRWEQLRDRRACVAEGGHHVGEIAGRYGAVEIVHPSPTDALIALRIGECDVMVHDSVMLEELVRFPEWKKFSRRLPPRPRSALAALVPESDVTTIGRVKAVADEWKADGFTTALVANAVRNIAFEVYLEQEVPDCH